MGANGRGNTIPSSSILMGGQLCPSTVGQPPLHHSSPVPAMRTASTHHQLRGGGRGLPREGGSSGRGLLAVSPFPVYCLGSSHVATHGVQGRCAREMKACQCPGVKLFSRPWAAFFQVLVQARGCITLPETSSLVLRALWKLCFIFTVWLRYLEASSLQTTALSCQAFNCFPQSFKSGVTVTGSF